MKKIVILLLPLIVVISVIFYLQGRREFNSLSFMDLLSTWRFDNLMNTLAFATKSFNEVGDKFRSIGNSANPLEVIGKIFTALYNLVVGFGSLITSSVAILIDLIGNIVRIVGWLFNTNYVYQ